jgi:hypothetical protein
LNDRSEAVKFFGEAPNSASRKHGDPPAARANLGDLRIVNIVEPQLEPSYAQFGDEIATAASRADDRNRLRGPHGFILPSNYLLAPNCRDYPASATGSIRLGSLFLTFPTRVLTGQQAISSAG